MPCHAERDAGSQSCRGWRAVWLLATKSGGQISNDAVRRSSRLQLRRDANHELGLGQRVALRDDRFESLAEREKAAARSLR